VLVQIVAQRNVCATKPDLAESPYFALQKGIAIGFLKAIGFRNGALPYYF
jgi:hypothetical protein